jgi:hypothetical protein
VEWMTEYYGSNQANWPAANVPLVASGPTPWQVFETGGNPNNSNTWLKTSLTKASNGMYLNWNSQPGKTYQIQVTTDFTTWSNYGSPTFAEGTSASVFVGNNPAGYYRVQLLWQ